MSVLRALVLAAAMAFLISVQISYFGGETMVEDDGPQTAYGLPCTPSPVQGKYLTCSGD